MADHGRPAWQTEELEDEWVSQDDLDDLEPDEGQHSANIQHTISDVSFTDSITGSTQDEHNNVASSSPKPGRGTFLIREDVPALPLLAKTPGKGKKGMGNNLFSQLAIEKMFEPPSPPSEQPNPPIPTFRTSAPAIPSRLSQVFVPSEDSYTTQDDGELYRAGSVDITDPAMGEDAIVTDFKFTFAPPGPSPLFPSTLLPNAQSTPGPPHMTCTTPNDRPLRLFHRQFDTFTRDHMSGLIDSIVVDTPSAGSNSAFSKQTSSSSISPPFKGSVSRLRSAKRLKLSPASDFANQRDGAATILRPPTIRTDYVGESKIFMEQLKQRQDFSTISTVSTEPPPPGDQRDSPEIRALRVPSRRQSSLSNPENHSSKETAWTASSSPKATVSSLAFRQNGANLLAQIRNDVKSHKRLLSLDTEASQVTHVEERPHDFAVSPNAGEDTEAVTFEGDTEIIEDVTKGGPVETTESIRARARQKASPRKLLRRLSAADEVDRELAQDISNVSLDSEGMLDQFPAPPVARIEFDPTTLAVPTSQVPNYPTASVRRNDDLTRFVSSSTASGTTATGSAASFVKHQGPKFMKHITPSDVPSLPDRVGKMVFDKELLKWVKASPDLNVEHVPEMNDSEDPFKDFDSIHEDDVEKAAGKPLDEDGGEDMDLLSTELEKSRIVDVPTDSEMEDEEEMELTSFTFDHRATRSEQDAEAGNLPLEDEKITETTGQFSTVDLQSDHSIVDCDVRQDPIISRTDEPALQDTPPHMLAPRVGNVLTTPRATARTWQGPAPTPIIRSAMKSSSITPVSALKKPEQSQIHTPANKTRHRRSVSFSDGKRDGPIVGIGKSIPTPETTACTEDESSSEVSGLDPDNALQPSARTKRISDMLDGLGDSFDDESPSKASSAKSSSGELQPLHVRRQSSAVVYSGTSSREISRRTFSQSFASRPSGQSGRDATFLTECSFGIAHDKLVQVITDVQPFEPYWDQLSTIDLSRKNIDSVVRLKEFLPHLDSLVLNSNHLSWLSGIPRCVRTLSVASNCLTSVTSFSHLVNLENLDISGNNIDSLRQLECLRHLRELRADRNMIDNIDGLQKMDGLVKLSLEGNCIQDIDLTHFSWTRLEMLNLNQNRLVSVVGLSSLPGLIVLNLDNNHLGELQPEGPMPRLRILRVCSNRLQQLNAAPFPNLRTLYADNNSLGPILKAHRLTKLEGLSLRNQSGRAGLSLDIRDVRDVKRLYLSGNPMKSGFISEPCYNLFYLELAACRLTSLPAEFSRLVPNVRVLNLNYNFLQDIGPLQGLTRLRKLTIIGSRIKATKQLVRVLKGMLDIEMVDFRMNPCTLGWYLPLLVKDVPGALQPSDGDRRPSSAGALQALSRPDGVTGRIGVKARGANGASLDHHHLVNPGAGHGPAPPLQGNSTLESQTESRRKAPGSEGVSWKDLDSKFRRDLPDEAYVGRLGYRGRVMRSCPKIHILDGVEVSEKEKVKAEKILESLVRVNRKSGVETQG